MFLRNHAKNAILQNMSIAWKKLRETYTQVGYRKIINKFYKLPDGNEGEFNVIYRPGAAGVFALTKDLQVIVARQYRPGQDAVCDEIPGGDIDPDEKPEQTAHGELLEETGYKANELIHLASIPRDAYMTGTWHYYLALDCELTDTPPKNDEYEFVELTTIPLETMRQNILEGKMTDAAAGLFALRELERRGIIERA